MTPFAAEGFVFVPEKFHKWPWHIENNKYERIYYRIRVWKFCKGLKMGLGSKQNILTKHLHL